MVHYLAYVYEMDRKENWKTSGDVRLLMQTYTPASLFLAWMHFNASID